MQKSEYTKQCITKAVIELLKTVPFDEMTITKLVEYAKVSRGAFYNNFNSLEDVLKLAYTTAYDKCFADKEKINNYLLSDQYIRDIICFFDENTQLILGISKWNLLSTITFKQTFTSFENAKQYDKFDQYNDYYIVYCWTNYFQMLLLWCLKGKQESSKEIYNLIREFDQSRGIER